jgi:hypothetical protein
MLRSHSPRERGLGIGFHLACESLSVAVCSVDSYSHKIAGLGAASRSRVTNLVSPLKADAESENGPRDRKEPFLNSFSVRREH